MCSYKSADDCALYAGLISSNTECLCWRLINEFFGTTENVIFRNLQRYFLIDSTHVIVTVTIVRRLNNNLICHGCVEVGAASMDFEESFTCVRFVVLCMSTLRNTSC